MARADEQPTEGTTETVTTQSGEQYNTRGQTRLATRQGHEFRPSDQNLPVITPEGVNMTATEAEAVLAESERYDGNVFRVDTKED